MGTERGREKGGVVRVEAESAMEESLRNRTGKRRRGSERVTRLGRDSTE